MPKDFEPRLFDDKNKKEHIGSDLDYSDHLNLLKDVELYFIKQCNAANIEVSFDCTAAENPHFKTLNYTTFAGMFMCHPLQFELSFFQMYDAIADNLPDVGHLDYIASNHSQGKYKGLVFNFDPPEQYNLAVVTGGNKFDTLNWDKLVELSQGDVPLVIKPHPVSNHDALDILQKEVPKAIFTPRLSDLYSLIKSVDTVYTTHSSETALTSLLMGKNISCIDKYPLCWTNSFSHIVHHCFTNQDALPVLGSAFASCKSGIVHPLIDANWQSKIDGYIDYIMKKRKFYKCHQ